MLGVKSLELQDSAFSSPCPCVHNPAGLITYCPIEWGTFKCHRSHTGSMNVKGGWSGTVSHLKEETSTQLQPIVGELECGPSVARSNFSREDGASYLCMKPWDIF